MLSSISKSNRKLNRFFATRRVCCLHRIVAGNQGLGWIAIAKIYYAIRNAQAPIAEYGPVGNLKYTGSLWYLRY